MNTARLQLRQWREDDLPHFAAINADPEVMRYFPAPLSREESDHMATRCRELKATRGWGLWAVEELDTRRFIGFVGLHEPSHDLPFAPCVEIGWRLAREFWGRGYATEAARRVLRYAFERLALDEIVSFTSVINLPSRAVMERLGLRNTHNNFAHPALPLDDRLSEHVLYTLSETAWQQSQDTK
ncbi:MAG: GNAT family N-acetyltransferase [Halioglobus sp.]|nr:GNAT family N-acetyltransferase [Halioglobus sp.]